jgi:hypothetical protein
MDLLKYVEILAVSLAVIGSATVIAFVVLDQKRLQRQLRRRHHEIARKAGQNALLQRDIHRLEVEELRLQEELRRSNEARARIESERDHLQTAIRHLEAEGLQLCRRLKEAEEKGRQAEEERQRVSHDVYRLETDLRQLREELQLARKEDGPAGKEVDPLTGEMRELPSNEHPGNLREEPQPEQTRDDETRADQDNAPETGREPLGLEPQKRGGRPRGHTTPSPAGTTSNSRAPHRKPEIICWKRERQWVPGVEIPDDLLGREDLEVLQDGFRLAPDDSNEGCWRLDHVGGSVLVRWLEDDVLREEMTQIDEKDYLLFRLSGQEPNAGFYVRSPSCGSYLVMVPIGWERNEAVSGPPFVLPEPVSLEGYQAHFFISRRNDQAKIAFRVSMGQDTVIQAGVSRFELVGAQLSDASEEMGPLFGLQPPLIRDLATPAWRGIQTIVVGEEGPGKSRWRTDFAPVAEEREQELPSVVANRRGGWYFIRIYDDEGDRIESLDFRFSSALKGIRIESHDVLPGHAGHNPVRVEFAQDATSVVTLVREGEADPHIERESGRTVAIIPAKAAWDLTEWEIEPLEGVRVSVEILVERIWWSLGEEGAPMTQIEMSDRPLPVSYDSFQATSTRAIHLYLPAPGWTQRVLVGFDESGSRAYRPKVNERIVSVPLRDFGGADPIRAGGQGASLKVWLERDGGLEGGTAMLEVLSETPIRLPAPVRPPVEPGQMRCCATCDHARRRNNTNWCRRKHWAAVARDEFDAQFARFLCGEWRGEYFDADGRCHVN